MGSSSRPYIFIDTSSLLDSCWVKNINPDGSETFTYSQNKENTFWSMEFEKLLSMGDIIIPRRNYEELIKHSQSAKKPKLTTRAKYALEKINALQTAGKIMIVGDANDPFADAILLSVALKFKTQRNLAFITQDRKLAADLEAIRNFKSVDNRAGYDIKIRRISKSGTLKPFDYLHTPSEKKRKHRPEGDTASTSKKSQSRRDW